MNTRDPFNLRRTSPLEYIQSGVRIAATTASNIQSHLSDSVGYAQSVPTSPWKPSSPAEISDNGMSSAVPRNVSASNDSGSHQDDSPWRSRKIAQNVVSEKIGSMFSSQEELPMYKDKPYSYSPSKRNQPLYRRRRSLLIIIVVVLALFYWITSSSGENDDDDDVIEVHTKQRGSKFGSYFGNQRVDWDERRDQVKEVFKASWKAYEDHAWGYDEFHPVSKRGRHMVSGGLGWIIVDSLDTLILMNLTSELMHARDWISTSLNYEKDHDVNTFETTIRMLGGLLSADYLSSTFPELASIPIVEGPSGDDLYLELAADLADRLLGAFNSPSGIPYASINLKTGQGIQSHADGGASSTAEAATLQLEMKYMANLTGEKTFWDKAEQVIRILDDNGAEDGLVPIYIHPNTGQFQGSNVRLGSRGDSYYEYLIKQYLQTSKMEPVYREMWDEALAGVRKHLITYSKPSNFTVLAERPQGLDQALLPKMDHLVCFMPGTIALGATEGLTVGEASRRSRWSKQQEEDMELAKQLMKTCWGMYKASATGLAGEITHFEIYDPPLMMKDDILQSPKKVNGDPDAAWRKDFIIKHADAHNLQRPETVESLFYMWRITGDIMYREWGWEMFKSFTNHTAVADNGGFSSISDVNKIPAPSRDNMESFWLAETLKYFYLLFSPSDLLPLDEVVFNTEAHPLPNFEIGRVLSTGWKRKPRDASGRMIQVAPTITEEAPLHIQTVELSTTDVNT